MNQNWFANPGRPSKTFEWKKQLRHSKLPTLNWIVLECSLQSGSSWSQIFRFRYLAKYQTVRYAFGVKSIDQSFRSDHSISSPLFRNQCLLPRKRIRFQWGRSSEVIYLTFTHCWRISHCFDPKKYMHQEKRMLEFVFQDWRLKRVYIRMENKFKAKLKTIDDIFLLNKCLIPIYIMSANTSTFGAAKVF